jgi:hypothetical protein
LVKRQHGSGHSFVVKDFHLGLRFSLFNETFLAGTTSDCVPIKKENGRFGWL